MPALPGRDDGSKARPILHWSLFSAAITLLLWYGAPHLTPRALADPAPTASVSSPEGLNLRSGPGTTYDVVAVMPNGAVVTISGAASDNWLPVTYTDKSGWADSAYLSQPQAAAATTPTPPATASSAPASPPTGSSSGTQTATVLPTDGLNQRSSAGTSSTVLGVLPGGAAVTLLGSPVNGWVQVSYNGTSGWVDASYLAMGGTSAAGPAITANAGSSSAAASLGPTAGSGASAAGTATITVDPADIGKPGPPETGLPFATPPASDMLKFIWPVDSRRISTRVSAWHQAIDIDEFPAGGQSVRAIADGIVVFAAPSTRDGYGIYVIIAHANGFSSLYAHFSAIEVSQGQAVKQGQELGKSGCTGRCTGPHLHFAIFYHRNPVDPISVLPPGAAFETDS